MNIHEFRDWLDKELNEICIMPLKCVAFESQIPCVEVTTPFLDTFNDCIQLYVAQRHFKRYLPYTYNKKIVVPSKELKDEFDTFVIFDDGHFENEYRGFSAHLGGFGNESRGMIEYQTGDVESLPKTVLDCALRYAEIARRYYDKHNTMTFETEGKE